MSWSEPKLLQTPGNLLLSTKPHAALKCMINMTGTLEKLFVVKCKFNCECFSFMSDVMLAGYNQSTHCYFSSTVWCIMLARDIWVPWALGCVALVILPSPSMHGNVRLRSVVIHAVTASDPVSSFLSVKNCTLLGHLRLKPIALKSWWRSFYREIDCQFCLSFC